MFIAMSIFALLLLAQWQPGLVGALFAIQSVIMFIVIVQTKRAVNKRTVVLNRREIQNPSHPATPVSSVASTPCPHQTFLHMTQEQVRRRQSSEASSTTTRSESPAGPAYRAHHRNTAAP